MIALSGFASLFLFLVPLLVQLSCAQSSGTLNFLTYNVAGLPEFLSDNGVPGDKTTNARTIGSKLAERAYDVVHMQEDFNYHAYIYETDDHEFRTPTTGGVPFGSGLNTIANYNWTLFKQVKWNRCFLNEADCLTPKGFSVMRLQLGNGVEIDFYNLHGDAGSEEGDIDARSSGTNQLLSYIQANSAGRAVVVAGDTNDRYTNTGRSIDRLIDAGFTDSWVDLIRDGALPAAGTTSLACAVPAASAECETVDKVL
ncbi:MAG: hypothetical protein Q9160_008205 [Pyrenula sp. 1 TL-2023]